MNIPNLPISPMTKEDGYPTDVEYQFRQQLIQALQQNAGPEGLVMPTVTPSELTTIQDNQNSMDQYTCQLGTMLYVMVDPADYTQDKVVIAFRQSNVSPYTDVAPLFKTVTVT